MYYNDHMPPHFHALFGAQEALFDLDGKIIEGKFPINKKKLVEAWIILHKEELEANWILAQNKAQIAQIDPLR
jgi:plasmid rolling circle replication initiator protein Rep